MRHLEARVLWVQDFVIKKFLAISGVKGEENEADVGTKILTAARTQYLIKKMGMMPLEEFTQACGESVAPDAVNAVRTTHTVDANLVEKIVRAAVAAVMMEQCAGLVADAGTCPMATCPSTRTSCTSYNIAFLTVFSVALGLVIGLVGGYLLGRASALLPGRARDFQNVDRQRNTLPVHRSRWTQTEGTATEARAPTCSRVSLPDHVFVTVAGRCYHLAPNCGGQPPTTKIDARRCLTPCSHCVARQRSSQREG